MQSFEPANVIPPYADVICDCRALPSQGEDDIHAHVEAALGDGFSYELEFLEPLEGGTESSIDTPLYRALRGATSPSASTAPRCCRWSQPGFTDSHWIRTAFGTAAYGFAPVFHTDPHIYHDGVHGADESIAVDDLVEMVEFNLRAIGARTQGPHMKGSDPLYELPDKSRPLPTLRKPCRDRCSARSSDALEPITPNTEQKTGVLRK